MLGCQGVDVIFAVIGAEEDNGNISSDLENHGALNTGLGRRKKTEEPYIPGSLSTRFDIMRTQKKAPFLKNCRSLGLEDENRPIDNLNKFVN